MLRQKMQHRAVKTSIHEAWLVVDEKLCRLSRDDKDDDKPIQVVNSFTHELDNRECVAQMYRTSWLLSFCMEA